jgi:hypothetical protein
METERRIGPALSPEGAKRSKAAAKRLDGVGPMWPAGQRKMCAFDSG